MVGSRVCRGTVSALCGGSETRPEAPVNMWRKQHCEIRIVGHSHAWLQKSSAPLHLKLQLMTQSWAQAMLMLNSEFNYFFSLTLSCTGIKYLFLICFLLSVMKISILLIISVYCDAIGVCILYHLDSFILGWEYFIQYCIIWPFNRQYESSLSGLWMLSCDW